MWNKQEEELQKFAVFLIFELFDQIHATDTALMDRFIAIWFDVKLMDWKRIDHLLFLASSCWIGSRFKLLHPLVKESLMILLQIFVL